MKVAIFTDGAARGNPDGPGGYGAIIRYAASDGSVMEKELSGGYPRTTNNRMELMGVIAALEEIGKIGEPCEGTIYSDSRYVVDAFQKRWIANWQRNGWKTSTGGAVKNRDLWERLLKAAAPHRLNFSWVKGHDDHPLNERCDRLATSAADRVGAEFSGIREAAGEAGGGRSSSDWVKAESFGSREAAGEEYGKRSGDRVKADSSGSRQDAGDRFVCAAGEQYGVTSAANLREPAQRIRIRYLSDKIDKLLPPTDSSNWIDLRSAEDVELKKGEYRLIHLGVAMKLPEGYEAHVVPRSSTYRNFGIIQANHHGIVDNSYCGDGDEWMVPIIAMRDTQIHVNDRICQFRIVRRQPDIIFEETDYLGGENRGGFGTTGIR